MKNEISRMLHKFNTLPFLFVGSGMSIRYLGLENWEGLLSRFAQLTSDNEFAYEMYVNKAEAEGYREGLLPKVAELIGNDLSMNWFTDDRFKDSRACYKDEIIARTSPLKIEIAKYFTEKSKELKSEYQQEIELLGKVGKKSIAGVITTNYDVLLESVFQDYTKFIGQEELIFSPIQGIAEIYKIHGCCTKPGSIVINERDYVNFGARNAYLAAKILTMFLEHPIIFLGYSISDKNIENILKAIIQCLSPGNLGQLKERLIFIEWNNTNEPDGISIYSKSFGDGKAIDMTRIKLTNYEVLYQALLQNKAKYNAPALRRLKQDIYDLILTSSPTSRMRVVGLEEDDKLDDVEIVIGVGVLSEFGTKGYSGITAVELYKDVVFDNGNLDPELVVYQTLPTLLKHHSNSIPIYKYISQVECLPERVQMEVRTEFDDLLSRTIRKQRESVQLKGKRISELRKCYGDMKSLQLIPYLQEEEINVDELGELLIYIMNEYPDLLVNGKSADKTNLRRLIKIYDWLKYYKK